MPFRASVYKLVLNSNSNSGHVSAVQVSKCLAQGQLWEEVLHHLNYSCPLEHDPRVHRGQTDGSSRPVSGFLLMSLLHRSPQSAAWMAEGCWRGTQSPGTFPVSGRSAGEQTPDRTHKNTFVQINKSNFLSWARRSILKGNLIASNTWLGWWKWVFQ